ncbi:phosphogluconate dehydrogenase (NAD(+)-dependent, decarboxylating) [Tundrisphaera lichenicola]|uniref:phosphogluconate dehydrogenase (NAD(+)-dependent, decarboxylating) n=1 Tax=Tundrisphaera lichenicola TaxID=2029860 RepID=UPI003EBBA270
MQLGMIGLGRMGGNMVRRLMKAGHECVVFDHSQEAVKTLAGEGAIGATSLSDFAAKLTGPKAAWVMVPAGGPTETTVEELAKLFGPGDIIIDGGNSFYKDDVRRAASIQPKGIHYVDVGTSGGVWGIERGYCMMIGGPAEAIKHLDPIFKTLAPGKGDVEVTPGRGNKPGTAEDGYLHCGPSGAGHFVKMVHNGIEYGLMQAYAEGFDIFRNASSKELPEGHRYELDLAEIAEVWRRGSVVGSWLLDLTAMALIENPSLSEYTGFVQDSGEGRWTVQAAIEEAVPADVLTSALYTRFRSRQEHTFAEKVLSAMRHKFGGHVERASGG